MDALQWAGLSSHFLETWSPGGWQGSAGSRCSLLTVRSTGQPHHIALPGPKSVPLRLCVAAAAWTVLGRASPHPGLLSTSRTGSGGCDALSLGVAGTPVPWDAGVLGHQGSSLPPITDLPCDPGVWLKLPSLPLGCL